MGKKILLTHKPSFIQASIQLNLEKCIYITDFKIQMQL